VEREEAVARGARVVDAAEQRVRERAKCERSGVARPAAQRALRGRERRLAERLLPPRRREGDLAQQRFAFEHVELGLLGRDRERRFEQRARIGEARRHPCGADRGHDDRGASGREKQRRAPDSDGGAAALRRREREGERGQNASGVIPSAR
jgi:hypothetical protein